RLDEKSTNRYQEQIGLPGTYITHFVIQKALESKGADASLMDKTALHGSQLMVNDDLLEFAKLLDTVASDEWCVPIFMGEVVEREHPRDYANFRHDALQRQTLLKEQAETTALYILDLAAEDYDRTKAPAKVEAFVKSLLLDVAKEDVKQQLHETGTADTTIVEQMFDARTAQDLQTVIALEAQGMARQAFELMQQVEERAPGGGYCGAGSCGLSAVDTSGEEGKGIADRLGAKAGDKVVKDSERSCKCGSKEIYYAYNSREVRKLCESCGKTEYKESPSSST
ncbi:MAG TPA: hypothetical protein VF598_08260, partial [Hymenobacter sp.]